MNDQPCFQEYMPGDVCFGCGTSNAHGLHIRSYWEGDRAVCVWQPKDYHQGWAGVTCGGIIATLVDCHCMATAMAHAIQREGRSLGSAPHYRFATGSITIRYLKPTPNEGPLKLYARVTDIKDERKYSLQCDVAVSDEITARAEVVAFLVWRSDQQSDTAFSA